MSDSVALEQCIPHRSPSSENHAFEMAQPFLGEASVKEENLPVKIMVELPRQEQERMPRVDFHQEVPQFPSSSSLGDAPQVKEQILCTENNFRQALLLSQPPETLMI